MDGSSGWRKDYWVTKRYKLWLWQIADVGGIFTRDTSGVVVSGIRRLLEIRGSFGAFSYGRRDLSEIAAYIHDQPIHHLPEPFQEEYIRLLHEFDIPYEDEYLFDFFTGK